MPFSPITVQKRGSGRLRPERCSFPPTRLGDHERNKAMGRHVTRDTIAMRPTDFERLDAPYPAPPYTTRTQQATGAKSAIAEAAAHSRVATILPGERLNKQEQVAMGASILDGASPLPCGSPLPRRVQPASGGRNRRAGGGGADQTRHDRSAEVAANPSALSPCRTLGVTAIVGKQ
jgi:hypothetical protein